MVRQVTEQTRAEISAAFGPDTAALLGTGLFFKGLGIARNMPSFKRVRYFCCIKIQFMFMLGVVQMKFLFFFHSTAILIDNQIPSKIGFYFNFVTIFSISYL